MKECVDILSNKIASGGGIVRFTFFSFFLDASDITDLYQWPVFVTIPFLCSIHSQWLLVDSDIFPSLKHLPTWAPGSGFLIKAAEWKAKMEE
jgi:hypothetical protein